MSRGLICLGSGVFMSARLDNSNQGNGDINIDNVDLGEHGQPTSQKYPIESVTRARLGLPSSGSEAVGTLRIEAVSTPTLSASSLKLKDPFTAVNF